jgi:heme-degrading monooxygenase HmoA
MIARVTLAEIDAVRTSVSRAVEVFNESVLPELAVQEGYEGCYVLATPEGKALVMTFWTDEAAAEAGIASGHYAAQVEKFVTLIRAAPGRQAYEVLVARPPVPAEAALSS